MIQAIINWIQNNPSEVIAVILAFMLFFEKLALLTPTKTDDKIVMWLYRIFKVLGVHVKDNPGKVDGNSGNN